MWVDEALMVHPGSLFLVTAFSGAARVVLVGDSHQLPYIERVPCIAGEFKLTTLASVGIQPTTYLSVSHRCPADVSARLSDLYPSGMKSSNRIFQSVHKVRVASANDIPQKHYVFLTFTQAEKQTLITRFRGVSANVATIQEYQGQTAKRVAVVRLSDKASADIYNSEPHCLVALSRHTESLVYYTRYSGDDSLTKMYQKTGFPRELRDGYGRGTCVFYVLQAASCGGPYCRLRLCRGCRFRSCCALLA